MITFQEKNHKYQSQEGQPEIDWVSVTKVIGAVCPPFDKEESAIKASKNKKSKWYDMEPNHIIYAWDEENQRSRDLGHWYHNKREQEYIGKEGVVMPLMDGTTKIARDQKLTTGIYPEHMVYLQSAGICGQSDLVTVDGEYLDIDDWKSNKEIRKQGYMNWEKKTAKMLAPMNHMEECEYSHYALQLSLYAYIIQRHNPQLKVRRLGIHHILFEEEGTNRWGYPIHKLDSNGEPIVKDIVYYDIPYLKSEAVTLIEYVKKNKQKILNSNH
jgi:hypothetical protein